MGRGAGAAAARVFPNVAAAQEEQTATPHAREEVGDLDLSWEGAAGCGLVFCAVDVARADTAGCGDGRSVGQGGALTATIALCMAAVCMNRIAPGSASVKCALTDSKGVGNWHGGFSRMAGTGFGWVGGRSGMP
jgi:hypothetical protein